MWPEVQEEMTRSLATMRVDYDTACLKQLDHTNNALLNKRRRAKQSANNATVTNAAVPPAASPTPASQEESIVDAKRKTWTVFLRGCVGYGMIVRRIILRLLHFTKREKFQSRAQVSRKHIHAYCILGRIYVIKLNRKAEASLFRVSDLFNQTLLK